MNIDINTLVNQLKIARKFYYDGKPVMTDLEFDMLEAKLREVDSNNEYFTTVGTPIRGEKVKHTIPMGSLDQVADATEIMKWANTSNNKTIIGTDKLDGNSVAIYYGIDGEIEGAVTRGDGIEGLDITRHIRRMLKSDRPGGYPFPRICPVNGPIVVRAEAIFSKEHFTTHVTGYKNPRNYVAGQLNRTVADQTFIDYVSFIAFDADLGRSKVETLDSLERYGFQVVPYYSMVIAQLSDQSKMEEILNNRKRISKYELDGIVLDFDDIQTRSQLGFEHLNPRYSVKFKINQEFVETEVLAVEWSPSKDAYMKPRIRFEPVDLAGVTISFATGFNAKFILDNRIGPGAIIRVTRSGDVIPLCEEVISPADEADMPMNYEDTCTWTETGVDLVLKVKPDESHIKEIVDFFTGIGAPLLKMGNVTNLYEAGFNSIDSIIKASEDELIMLLGENGIKVYMGLKEKLSNIDEYILAGSLPMFGRGVGKRKIKALAEAHGDITKLTYDMIIDTPGFDEKTALKVAEGVESYKYFLTSIKDYVNVRKYEKLEGDLNDVAVCFTGVRSKDLEAIIESRGGRVLSSASKQMTHLVAKDPNGKSGKLDKARKQGVIIISLDEAGELWSDS